MEYQPNARPAPEIAPAPPEELYLKIKCSVAIGDTRIDIYEDGSLCITT